MDIQYVAERHGLSAHPHIWVVIYYCIRCGQLQKALDVAEAAHHDGSGEVPVDVLQALSVLVELQRDQSVGLLNKFDTLRRQVKELSSSNGGGMARDVYRDGVINLLSLSSPYDNHCPDPFTRHVTKEDWLWQCLWFATTVPGVYSLRELQSAITSEQSKNKFFAAETQNPFLYAYFLLSVQEFSQAVNHMWEAGWQEEAVHMAIALNYYGALRVTTEAMDTAPSRVRLARFLQSYAKTFQRTDPHIAFDYLLQLKVNVLLVLFCAVACRPSSSTCCAPLYGLYRQQSSHGHVFNGVRLCVGRSLRVPRMEGIAIALLSTP